MGLGFRAFLVALWEALGKVCRALPSAWPKLRRASKLYMWRLDEQKLGTFLYLTFLALERRSSSSSSGVWMSRSCMLSFFPGFYSSLLGLGGLGHSYLCEQKPLGKAFQRVLCLSFSLSLCLYVFLFFYLTCLG